MDIRYETPKKITYTELMDMIGDLDTTDAQIRPYLREKVEDTTAFDPQVEIDWSLVIDDRPMEQIEEEGAIAVPFLNSLSRGRRRRLYERKIRGGWNGIKIVSEGDSWFQYPWLLDDVIDHLMKQPDMAVRSLGAAGDLLRDMISVDEYTRFIRDESPAVFLISGGGNDLVHDNHLAQMLQPFLAGRDPAAYPNEKFDEFEQEVTGLYSSLFARLGQEFPNLKILCHGYDYAIPNHGNWLGRPMESIGIVDRDLQRRIIRVVMDRFNNALVDAVNQSTNATHIDARSLVTNWHDELHPQSEDYALVAAKFANVIRTLVA